MTMEENFGTPFWVLTVWPHTHGTRYMLPLTGENYYSSLCKFAQTCTRCDQLFIGIELNLIFRNYVGNFAFEFFGIHPRIRSRLTQLVWSNSVRDTRSEKEANQSQLKVSKQSPPFTHFHVKEIICKISGHVFSRLQMTPFPWYITHSIYLLPNSHAYLRCSNGSSVICKWINGHNNCRGTHTKHKLLLPVRNMTD